MYFTWRCWFLICSVGVTLRTPVEVRNGLRTSTGVRNAIAARVWTQLSVLYDVIWVSWPYCCYDQRWAKDPIDRSSDTDSIFRLYRPIQSVDFKFRFLYRPIASVHFKFRFFNRPILIFGFNVRFLYRQIVSVRLEVRLLYPPDSFCKSQFLSLYRSIVSPGFEFRI